eukprot:TRINITY_DN45720_c0_g1_i1.p1 TRINITY_DN45720_c0_g1~~TRINITY_DN45720_c0_g1_i1.p1  ORF type:complete len:229 (-),score=28.60 TRINITY_DN45720_c0_g1_i1:96-782(-)
MRWRFGLVSRLCRSYSDWVSTAIPIVWSGCDVVLMQWRAGRYIYGTRWLLEFAILPFCGFPLSIAAVVKVFRLLEAAAAATGRNVQHDWLWSVLFGVVGTGVFVVVFLAIWLPGPLLVTLDETLEVEDLVLLLRYILLTGLTTYLVLGQRRADSSREATCQQSELEKNEEEVPSVNFGGGKASTHAAAQAAPEEVHLGMTPSPACPTAEVEFTSEDSGFSFAVSVMSI